MAKRYDTRQRQGESLEQQYKRLAKVADQRLVRLEKLSRQEGFETATKWAYGRAMRDIQAWSPNMTRFNVKMPTSKAELLSKIRDMEAFINSETSTKQGIVNVYKKRADSINQKYGTNFKWDELAEYYLSGTAEKLSNSFGSSTALRAIAEIQKLGSDEVADIRKSNNAHVVVKDELIANTIDKMLADSNIDISIY